MNILIISAMFPPIQTGTAFYTLNVSETLRKNGHNVTVITTKNSAAKIDNDYKFELIRIPALHIPSKNYFKHLRFCSLFPSNYFLISRIIKERKPDAILLVNHYLDIAFPAVTGSRWNSIPLYVSVGTQMQSNSRFKNGVLGLLDRMIVGGIIFPNSAKIICWDKEIARYIKTVHNQENACKSIIIPYGVNGDLSFYSGYKHDYSLNNQIIGVGSIIDQRNFIFQIKVFRELLKTYPDLIFKIIGHEYIDKPRSLVNQLGIADKVIFTGELPHSEVLKEISRSMLSFTVTSGLYTGLGTATIEAMLMGVPVISLSPEDLFGNEAKLTDMVNYVFTDGVSTEQTLFKIRELIENQFLRMAIGTSGRQFVNEFMNWDYVISKMTDLFKTKFNN